MSEKRRTIGLLALLVAAVIWGAFNLGGAEETATAPSLSTIAPLPVAPSATTDRVVIDTTYIAGLSWGEDPFRRIEKRAHRRPSPKFSWVLGGISYNSSSPIAFINKQMVKIGGRVNDATVIDINKTTVTLEHNGVRFQLNVTEG